jgi:hypothetical protein
MAAIAPITVDDGQATPVSHVFNPIQVSPATYRENGVAGTPNVGENEVILTLKGQSQTINKVVVTLRVPILETLAGSTPGGYEAPPKVAYYLQANLEFLLPVRSTSEQRKNLRVLAKNLLTNTQVLSAVDTLEKPY